jgi:hypothetical protein
MFGSVEPFLLAFGRRLPMFSRSILLKTVFIGLVLATMASICVGRSAV